jgi:hypothetical protein
MKHDFWKQLSPLDGFLIVLNCALLLALFTAGGCQYTESSRLAGTAQQTRSMQQSTAVQQNTAVQQSTAVQPAPKQPEAAPTAFTADDAGFIAAMLAP